MTSIQHRGEDKSNAIRATITHREPIALRTFTPTQAVLAKSRVSFIGLRKAVSSTTIRRGYWSPI
jgi:hypothetical protein